MSTLSSQVPAESIASSYLSETRHLLINNSQTSNSSNYGVVTHNPKIRELLDTNGVLDLDEVDSHLHKKKKCDTGMIGMLGSIAITVNSLTGPAMLNLPATFQISGLIPTIFTLIMLCVLSALCSLTLSDVISNVPGNNNFRKEIEYSEVFRIFWSKKAFVVTQILFFCCTTCLNIVSIVDMAQVLDNILSKSTWVNTIAFRISYNDTIKTSNGNIVAQVVHWSPTLCSVEQLEEGDCVPFCTDTPGGSFFIISAGYVLACVLFLPLSLMDLKENTLSQIVGFIMLLVLSCQFIISFILNGVDFSLISLWGSDWNNLFGVILFNFAAVIAVPAWLYEKKENVDVSVVLTNSSIISVLLYISVGVLGALSMPDVSENMLQSMMTGKFGLITEICSEIFAVFIIGLGIPLFSVLCRLNLTGSGICSKFLANILAVYLPWGVSWIFYVGGSTTNLLGWGGILFTSVIAFLAPLLLSLHTILKCEEEEAPSPMNRSFWKSKSSKYFNTSLLLLIAILSIALAIFGEMF